MSARARSARRARPARRVSYREPSSDDDDFLDGPPESRAVEQRRARQARRDRRHRIDRPSVDPADDPNAAADDDDDDEHGDDDHNDIHLTSKQPSHQRRRPRHRPARSSNPASALPSATPSPRKKRRVAFLPPTPSTKLSYRLDHPAASIPSDGHNPPWASLPLAVLCRIFQHAAQPLRDDALNATQAVMWLIGAATACKAFSEPALSVLYEEPPLVDLGEPHRLLALLRRDSSSWHINYAAKIRRLVLDAQRVLAYSVPGSGLISVVDLIRKMPRLSHVDFTDAIDRPPYRQTHPGKWWTYPPDMFAVMDTMGIRLRGWRWHARMLKHSSTSLLSVETMLLSRHRMPLFHDLNHLALSHFHLDKPHPNSTLTRLAAADANESGLPAADAVLGRVLAPLARLSSLELTSCFAELWLPVLSSLPPNLAHLSISNSSLLASEDVRPFLLSHGRHLRSLTLDHNQALSLHFLTDLKASCPRLERLHVDLTYYNSVAMYRDSDPLFDALLAPAEPPTWPAALESVELLHLRQWDAAAAESFFTSLLDAAPALPHLRALVLKGILNINWRERAGFRGKWIGRLRRVFLERAPPPDHTLMSLKAFRLSRGILDPPSPTTAATTTEDAPTAAAAAAADGRRSQRLKAVSAAAQRAAASAAIDALRPRRTNAPAEDDADDTGDDAWTPPHVQGRCATVDVLIDNLRPSELQFTEGDFLDDEASGDDDWTGADVDTGEGSAYAW